MKWHTGLNRQILVLVASVTFTSSIIVCASFYIVFIFLEIYLPGFINYESWFSGTDLFTLIAAIIFALAIGSALAFKLAKRILAPLNSVAAAARQITHGDLAARALIGDQSLSEIAHLVNDFNSMAQRLEGMADNVTYWNAAIAHELRTPLTILKGKIQGAADGVFATDDQLFHSLLIQIDGLTRLVNDLRIVTLADAGQLKLELVEVRLDAEIAKAIDAMEPLIKSKKFIVDLLLLEIKVQADPIRLRQAVVALINNALHYANPGIIQVLTLVSADAVIIRIEDSGPGLPADFEKRAFEPFVRADSSRSRRYGGAGLGLSIVRAIAEAHGGKATCRNASKGGAVFEISLPFVRS